MVCVQILSERSRRCLPVTQKLLREAGQPLRHFFSRCLPFISFYVLFSGAARHMSLKVAVFTSHFVLRFDIIIMINFWDSRCVLYTTQKTDK